MEFVLIFFFISSQAPDNCVEKRFEFRKNPKNNHIWGEKKGNEFEFSWNQLNKLNFKFDAVVFNHVLQYFFKEDFRNLLKFLKKNNIKNVVITSGKQNFLSRIVSYCFLYLKAHSGTICSYEYQKKWIKKHFTVIKSSDIFFINTIFLLRLKWKLKEININ